MNKFAIINRHLIPATFICIFLCHVLSCKKFVQIGPPTNQLVSSSVFTNDQSANAAQLAVFAQMSSGSSFKISWYCGLSADELINYNSNPSLVQLYANGLVPANTIIKSIWSDAYNFIFEENSIIENLRQSGSISRNVNNQLTGEAKFIRAFWHFYLVNLFGDVPLVTTTDYKMNAVLPRSPKSEVYKQIIADLTDAEKLLSNDYVDSDGLTVTNERTRPVSSAAAALLARVYLFNNDWVHAAAQADKIIARNYYSLPAVLNDVFLANSPEAIWQLKPVIPDQDTPEGYTFILSGKPSTVSLNKAVVDALDSNDKRKAQWIQSVSASGDLYYYPFKYQVQSSASLSEYSMVLRLAEQYLIRAESRAQQNDITGSLSDLNMIRRRAGLTDFNTLSKDVLLAEILHERFREFFTEWGHRWLDLKRTQSIDSTMPPVTIAKGGVWKPYQQFYPVPQSERDNDKNLNQNPGY